MRRISSAALALAALVAVSTTPLHAQAQFFVQGSATLPSGDLGDGLNTGWMANVGLSVWQTPANTFKLWVEGFYGQNKFDGNSDAKSSLYGGLASGTYNLTSGGSATPYVIASAGYLRDRISVGDFSDSDGGLAYGAGVGVSFSKLFLEGRYMGASINSNSLSFIMLGAGVMF